MCGGAEHDGSVLLPFGASGLGHAWLHGACWRPWQERRHAEAKAALAAMGVRTNSSETANLYGLRTALASETIAARERGDATVAMADQAAAARAEGGRRYVFLPPQGAIAAAAEEWRKRLDGAS